MIYSCRFYFFLLNKPKVPLDFSLISSGALCRIIENLWCACNTLWYFTVGHFYKKSCTTEVTTCSSLIKLAGTLLIPHNDETVTRYTITWRVFYFTVLIKFKIPNFRGNLTVLLYSLWAHEDNYKYIMELWLLLFVLFLLL